MLLRETFNGWKNRQTWNVALWINNDEPLYRKAVAYVQKCKQAGTVATYRGFLLDAELYDRKTPDGCSFCGPRLSYAELDAMLQELE